MSERGEALEREPREQTVPESMMHLPCSRDCLWRSPSTRLAVPPASVFSTAHGSREPRCRSAASGDPAPHFHYRQRDQRLYSGKTPEFGGGTPPKAYREIPLTPGTRCPAPVSLHAIGRIPDHRPPARTASINGSALGLGRTGGGALGTVSHRRPLPWPRHGNPGDRRGRPHPSPAPPCITGGSPETSANRQRRGRRGDNRERPEG